jgi:secreted PhoX family phosphatase
MDQAAAGSVWGPTDGNNAQKIDHPAGSTDAGIRTAEGDEESAGGKHPGSRDETAEIGRAHV